jgi:hypothetical protein
MFSLSPSSHDWRRRSDSQIGHQTASRRFVRARRRLRALHFRPEKYCRARNASRRAVQCRFRQSTRISLDRLRRKVFVRKETRAAIAIHAEPTFRRQSDSPQPAIDDRLVVEQLNRNEPADRSFALIASREIGDDCHIVNREIIAGWRRRLGAARLLKLDLLASSALTFPRLNLVLGQPQCSSATAT